MNLESECLALHQIIFKKECSKSFIQDYIKVHEVYAKEIDEHAQKWVFSLIDKKQPVVDLEFFMRLLGKRTLLSQKLEIIIYLAENQSSYHSLYFRESDAKWSFLFFITAAFRVFYSIICGGISYVCCRPK